MSETLVIRLLPATETTSAPDGRAAIIPDGHAPDMDSAGTTGAVATSAAEWAVVDGSGACVIAPATGSPSLALPASGGRRVIALVPATRVLRTRAEVPVKGTSRIAQALPFALEDLMAEDVEELHFAAGPRLPDGQVAVAVVRREWMEGWRSELAAAGISAQALYADSDGVPEVAGNTTLLLEERQAILRDPGLDPVVTELAAVDGMLELWLAQTRRAGPDGVVPSRHLQVYDATVDGLPNSFWEHYQDRVESLEVRRLPDGALLRLAASIVTQPGINLLQGDFAQRASAASYWPRWRLAAALVAALAVTMTLVAGADVWRLKKESAALQTELRAAASFTFPGVDVGSESGSNLRRLVDARLQGSGGSAGVADSRQFLKTLQTVADAVAKTSDASVEGLNYRSGVMELQVRAPSADALDTIRRLVTEDGKLQADIQSSNSAGDQIQGRIRISVAGA
ncbi:MAG: type II secretion system protein GspL [Gammaproteobacteria bacterium]